jgi:hypothetical protein
MNTLPSWNCGDTIKLGTKELKVLSIETVRNGLPSIYHLMSLDGSKDYEYIVNRGLRRL